MNILGYLQDVLSGKVAAEGALGQNNYDPAKSFAQNALNPSALQRAMDVALGVSGGGLATKPYRLAPAKAEDVGYPYGGPGLGGKVYRIEGPEGHQGILQARIRGDTATIDDIFDIAGGRNFLGPSAMRGLLDQFIADNPSVLRLAGERVSGARFGGKTVEPGAGVDVSTLLPRRRTVEP